MLKAIHITNYQSHPDTYVEFHPGVNVIVGTSRFGKSALLRSMIWGFTGIPKGDRFRSRWGGPTTFTAYFSDGTLSREKDNSSNLYTLERNNEVEEYKGFGQAIPEPIERFINMDAINFQKQLDPPFMFSWTPGERGLFLNKISNLEIIDRSIGNIKRMIKNDSDECTYLTTSIKELDSKLSEYDFIPDLEKDLQELEKTQERLLSVENKIRQLESLIDDIEQCNEALSLVGDIPGAEKELQKLEKKDQQAKQLEEEAKDLKGLIQDIEETQNKIKRNEKEIDRLEKEFRAAFPDICPLCGS